MPDRVPRFVADTIAALRAERLPMGARLDAIDLALENLRRVWPDAEAEKKKGGVNARLAVAPRAISC